jgi:hypothetical protein
MKLRILALACLWASPVSGASIGLYSTPDCTSCTLRIPPSSTTGTLYICASTTDFLGDAIGAWFKVEGLPAGWFAAAVPAPGATASGDPFGAGVSMSFNPVLKGDCDVLYTVTLTPPSPGAQAILHVTHKDDPPLGAQCPLLESDLPACAFCPFCVAGGTMFVNTDTDCTVAVQQRTWSQVKSLFH